MKISTIYSWINYIHHKINYNHKHIRNKIIKVIQSNTNDLYDYGEGFFYQSIPPISLKGLRDTKKRVDKLNLKNYLKNLRFLDIGTNIGSIPLSIDLNFKYGFGIDHNGTTIKVAQIVQDYLKIKNLKFVVGDFLNYKFDEKFDVILSLANHSTFDEGITDTDMYFNKIYSLLNNNGILILESHNPLYEKPASFLKIIQKLDNFYEIIEHGKYEFGNFYDKNRLFYVLKKKQG